MNTKKTIQALRLIKSDKLLKDFFLIADSWALSINEQIIIIGEPALLKLDNMIMGNLDIALDDETMMRLNLLSSIQLRLSASKPDDVLSTYIRTKSAVLNGQSPLDKILNDPSEGLPEVIHHVMKIGLFGGGTNQAD